MLDEITLPVHPFTGVTALGVLPSGRVVWPALGGAEGDGDDAGDGSQGDGTDDGQNGDGGGTGGDDDALGDAGKRALTEERRARRDAERARKAAEAERDDLRAKLAAGTKQDGGQGDAPDAEQIRRDADKAATTRANERILRSEIRAAAAGKLTDPADALAYLDLSKFEVGDDGTVDEQEIADAIGDLIKAKPYLGAAKAGRFEGTGDGGAARRQAGPKQATEAEYTAMTHAQRVKARREGRLVDVLGGTTT